jgi:hypothetical protein
MHLSRATVGGSQSSAHIFIRNLLLGGLAFFAVSLRAGAAPAPVVAITPARITVSGVAHGAQVLFFGVGMEPKGLHIVRHQWSTIVEDTDKDGSVVFDIGHVTWNAVWVIVELQSAHYTIASTPGFPTLRAWRPHFDFRKGGADALDQFAYRHVQLQFLYFVPGGAWTLETGDGEATDADHTPNGETAIDLHDAVSLLPERDKGGRAFTPGGTLIAIDPSRLDVLELKIDGSMLGGAR